MRFLTLNVNWFLCVLWRRHREPISQTHVVIYLLKADLQVVFDDGRQVVGERLVDEQLVTDTSLKHTTHLSA